jgi:hypothetical protein
MTSLPQLVLHDTAELLEGEPAFAWSWSAPEPGCPMLGRQASEFYPYNPTGREAGQLQKDSTHG